MYAISVVGVAIGPYSMGLIFDAFGGTTYTQAYLAGITLSVTALVIVVAASRPSRMKTYRDLTPD